MILRGIEDRIDPFVVDPHDPFPTDTTHAVPVARHARAHPDRPAHDAGPGSIWALWTMVLWAMAATTTVLSVVTFGPVYNGLWLLAVVMYAGGIVTLLAGWERLR